MSAIATQQGGTLALSNDELIDVLTTSLYPGANRQSVKMVLGYCKAAGLDPMQKPVHIVPMWDGKAKQMRDVVMPGVGLYRTQAARTGQFAGQTEPEFGPMLTHKIGGFEITYPEWARVTVKKLMPNGSIAEFTATEYWIENYATKGGQEKSVAPNAMWAKRPRGQIAKCAAAQALRLAFPEGGAQPTAEEMEGKVLNEFQGTTIDADTGEIAGDTEAAATTFYNQADFDANLAVWTKVIKKGQKPDDVIAKVNSANPKTPLSDAQKDRIRALAQAAAASTAGATDAVVKLSHADVLAKLRAATDEDALNTVLDLASSLERTDEERAAEEACYDERLAALRG